MRIAKTRRAPGDPAPDDAPGKHPRSIRKRLPGVLRIARKGAAILIVWAPGALRATNTTAGEATGALQTLPDSTLRWLAASSVGLGAGLYLAGAPRMVTAAGVAPALFVGAAIVSRPVAHVSPTEAIRQEG